MNCVHSCKHYNVGVILETFTHIVIAQRYIPDIAQGDKRILLITGQTGFKPAKMMVDALESYLPERYALVIPPFEAGLSP